MRTRLIVASALVTLSAAVPFFGCGDDTVAPVTGGDAASDATNDTSSTGDGNVTDGGGGGDGQQNTDSGDSGPQVPPSFAYVHAAPQLGPIVVCTKIAGSFTPDTPSQPVPALSGFHFPLSASDALALTVFPSQDFIIPLAAIPTTADGGMPSCTAIVGGTGGVPQTSVFPGLFTAAGTLKAGKSYMFVLLGCSKGDDGGALNCGADFDGGTTTVREALVELDMKTKVAAGSIGAQFLHVSTQAQVEIPEGVKSAVVYPDGGFVAVGQGTTFTPNPTVPTPTTVVGVPGALTNVSATTFSLFDNVDGGVPNAPLGADFPLDLVALFSTGDPDASVLWKDRQNYTFVLLGDPAVVPNDTNDGIRIVAVPNGP